MAKFTHMKRRFCDNILAGMNGTKSAIDAGFSAATADQKASHLLKEPEVIAYIEAAEHKALKKAEISAEWILREIKDIVHDNKKDDPRAALKGLELLGKNKKLWVDVTENKFDLTQMGRVMMKDAQGNAVALEFNVGQEPNLIDAPKK